MDKLELFKYLKEVYFFELERRRKIKLSSFLEMLPLTIMFLLFSCFFTFNLTQETKYYVIVASIDFGIFIFLLFHPIVTGTDVPLHYMWHTYKMGDSTIVEYIDTYLNLNAGNEDIVHGNMLNFAVDNIQKAIIENHNETNKIQESYNRLKKFTILFFLLLSLNGFLFLTSYIISKF